MQTEHRSVWSHEHNGNSSITPGMNRGIAVLRGIGMLQLSSVHGLHRNYTGILARHPVIVRLRDDDMHENRWGGRVGQINVK